VYVPLPENIFQINLIPLGNLFETSCYVVVDKKNILIETGSSSSHENLVEGLHQIGLKPEDIDEIIVSHIHLDHSGGAGLFMEKYPKANIWVNSKGARHLIDPYKLVEGSRGVYGDYFEDMFFPVVPIPESRVHVVQDGESLIINDDRALIFYDTPGHALHHSAIYDTGSKGIFTGDSAGLYFKSFLKQFGIDVCLPSTTPTQFDPKAMIKTLDHLLNLNPKYLFFTHFGMSDDASSILSQVQDWMELFGDEAINYYKETRSLKSLNSFLKENVSSILFSWGVPEDSELLSRLDSDLELNAQGIVSYVKRLEKYDCV
jgi:glyoxylase-like metal-dependent hydrolase (beta-lactamase superfamily II)